MARRNDILQMSIAEQQIVEAMASVEKMGADVRLTDAINFLQSARDKIADYIEGIN